MTTRIAIAGLAAAALTLGACGGGPEASTTTVALPPTATAPAATTTTPAEQATAPDSTAQTAPPADPEADAARSVRRTVRAYVAALDDGDGAAVCELLAPGAIDAVDLPVQRGGCGASLGASIGYRDPRGLPVWEGARVARVRTPDVDPEGGQAKAIATVVTTFADRDETSVEDDVVYLIGSRDRWLVAKPSSTLYRAVGIADVPVSVLSPPD